MRKMNFSRSVYFREFCNKIIESSKYELKRRQPELLLEIDHQIDYIVKKQEGGYWGITLGDRLFIENLKLIRLHLADRDIKKFVRELIKCKSYQLEEKLKIVFFAQETEIWPSLESIYKACEQDNRFIVQLVYIPFVHVNADTSKDNYKIYKEKMHLPIINWDVYSVTEESPDIVVYVKPYDGIPRQFYIDEIDKVVRRCVFIRYGFEIADWNIFYHFQLPLHYIAWKFIVYGNMVKKLAEQYSYNNGKNVVAWGHPRADYYKGIEAKEKHIPQEWKQKINHRKVILWNTQHTILPNIGAGTYFKWKDEIFSYFSENTDIFLLWRPHPLMFGALINNACMSENDLKSFIDELSNKDNIIVDRAPDYRAAFYASDAIITDGTAFFIEYLYTQNPLLFTPKENAGGIYFKEEICNNLYVAEREGDIIHFLNMVKQNVDPMREKREQLRNELLTIHPEGNGIFIKNKLFEELMKECNNV